MNVNLYGCQGKWIMVDLGMTFSGNEYPGVELVFADLDFIEERRKDLIAIVLTHAHEDHIGAVPYFAGELGVPLYATPFTADLVARKLEEAGLLGKVEIIIIEEDHGEIELGPFTITYLPLAHSIAEGNALLIDTPHGRIFHTGDWKIDPDPLIGHPLDEDALARLGGAISPRHLLDALPVGDPVCILDFVMTNKGMLVHAVLREGAQARVVAILAPELSGEVMQELALAWGPEMVRVPDLERHRAVLDHVGKVLHDQLFCHLAHWVTEQRAGQVIIVPDLLTRHLPLHLARVCAKDIAIPGVPTEGAEYFCEVLPVEYAPCVQAVALSQHQRRPGL